MLSGLRWRLTALYLLLALALTAAVAALAYYLVEDRLLSTVDDALRQKTALTASALGGTLSADLESAREEYEAGRPEEVEGEDETADGESESYGAVYAADLASVFILAADEHGRPLSATDGAARIPIHTDALAAATASGLDLRTITASNGTRYRLLTYRFQTNPAILLQAGHSLAQDDVLLQRLLIGLLVSGAVSAAFLGTASWWLAGRALAPAREAWDRQQAFIANASHELRAPLTLMRAGVDVAQRSLPPDAKDSRALLDDSLRECDRMTGLVGDLLLLSRLDAGRLPMQITVCRMEEMISEAAGRVRHLAAEKSIRLAVSGEPESIVADAERLQQVLLILLDNAIRHTPPGGTVELAGRRNGPRAEIMIRDSGEGIPRGHIPRVFDRFYRVDSTRGKARPGAGLGLSIACALIEAQKGDIRLESELGRGTTATVILPNR